MSNNPNYDMVGKIISDLAEFAKTQEGRVIKVSSAALGGWAEAFNQLKDRHQQHTYCAYCGEEFPADTEDAINNVEKHIWSCEKHPLQRLRHYIEEKCKDLDFEAQELLMTEKETDLSHASGIHKSIDAIREVLADAERHVGTIV